MRIDTKRLVVTVMSKVYEDTPCFGSHTTACTVDGHSGAPGHPRLIRWGLAVKWSGDSVFDILIRPFARGSAIWRLKYEQIDAC